jgi:hypothetical protein
MIRIIATTKEGQASFPSDLGPFMMADDEPLDEMEEILPKDQPAPPGNSADGVPDEAMDVPVAPTAPLQSAPMEDPFSGEPIVGPEEPEEPLELEEVSDEPTELEQANQTLPIRQKIEKSLLEGYPLRILYTTLKGHTTERTVLPDYYLYARTTGNMVLIAWCELRNAWRGFIVERIRAAKLEPKNA